MSKDIEISTVVEQQKGRGGKSRSSGPRPVLLVARAPEVLTLGQEDRAKVEPGFTVGRSAQCSLTVPDNHISQMHFAIETKGRQHTLRDLGSTNGTFVNGKPVDGDEQRPLMSPSVIRAGGTVFVFEALGNRLLDASAVDDGLAVGMIGPFHGCALLSRLKEAAFSKRAPLLDGPSGAGKELAAAVLARCWKLEPPRRYNVSAAANPEEMSRVLFGVAPGAYTGVEQQDGLIVTADKLGQPLFLDEVHNLPVEAQATLLTVIEDKKFSRKGAEDQELSVDVQFIFASNEPDKLKPDLRARLLQVRIPPLRERVADAPAIFDHLLAVTLARQGIAPQTVFPALDVEFYHDLCLEILQRDRFTATNVRGLFDLADRITARVAAGVDPAEAVDSVCEECMTEHAEEESAPAAGSGAGHYEDNRDMITAIWVGCGKNAKRTVDMIRQSGVPWTISRRHLIKYLQKWGLK